MANNGTYYGNSSMGYGYSPDRSRDVDRYNPSTPSRSFLSYEDRMVMGSRSGGYYGTYRGY